jgi:hypothetical protein
MADKEAPKTQKSAASPKLDTAGAKAQPFVADRTSDMAPTPEAVDANRDKLNPTLGEDLAREAVEKRSATGGDLEIVDGEAGNFSVVRTPVEDQSDNGKVYKDERINPRDTNAPDAGLTPDGRRIAE